MLTARINEVTISKSTDRSGEDAVSLGRNILKVTIKCASDSASNVYVGWNGDATNANELQPGESATYEMVGYYLDGNQLYVAFDNSTNTGKALVSILNDITEKPIC